MKFLHLADLHLGKTLGDFDLKDDQRYILQQILEIAETKQVDAVLIAGDVFDKTVPSVKGRCRSWTNLSVNWLNGICRSI